MISYIIPDFHGHSHSRYHAKITMIAVRNPFQHLYPLISISTFNNTVRILILYKNITNICHKLIIYSDWAHLINIHLVTYIWYCYPLSPAFCVGIMCTQLLMRTGLILYT